LWTEHGIYNFKVLLWTEHGIYNFKVLLWTEHGIYNFKELLWTEHWIFVVDNNWQNLFQKSLTKNFVIGHHRWCIYIDEKSFLFAC